MRKSKLAVAVLGALFAMSAEAATYVLQAGKWGARQAAAVAGAGGTIRYASEGAGIAVVDSANPGFLAAIKASATVTSAVEDMVLEFKVPTPVADVEAQAAIVPQAESFYAAQWAPAAIEAPAVWDMGITGNGVRVAIIDGGVYDAHADLRDRVEVATSTSFATQGASGVGGCSPTAFNCDIGTFWHGTHVAGIVAGSANGIGTIGIAPEATLIGVKALHGGTGSFGAVISAILYSATPVAAGGAGADIINLSLGADVPRGGREVAELMTALNRAVNYATARGALVVVAAGNDGYDMDATRNLITVPAESGNAIAIAAAAPSGWKAAIAATNFGDPASYTNFGNSLVWMSGPGGDDRYPGNEMCAVPRLPSGFITNPCWVFDLVMAPTRGAPTSTATFGWAAGTSMAAPAVAGVAALMKQANPSLTPAQLKTRLAQGATDVLKPGQDAMSGHGFLNALRSVTR